MYTIYTSPGCGPCMTVKAHLRAHKIPHTLVDVSQDPAAVEKLRKMGYSSAPVTVDEATGEHWHGYLPDRYASPAPEAAPAADVQATIDVGPVEAGEHVLWDPRQGHLLIIGDRDSGKSVIQRGIMETAVSVGWQAWGLGLPGELDKVEDHRYAQVVTADVSDQLERIRAASELMRERYHLVEVASLAKEHPEPFQPIVLVLDDYAHLRQRWADLAPAGEHRGRGRVVEIVGAGLRGRLAGVGQQGELGGQGVGAAVAAAVAGQAATVTWHGPSPSPGSCARARCAPRWSRRP